MPFQPKEKFSGRGDSFERIEAVGNGRKVCAAHVRGTQRSTIGGGKAGVARVPFDKVSAVVQLTEFVHIA